MSRIGWIQFFSIISLQCLVFPLANANHADFCFSSSFSRAIGYILRGFLLGEVEVSSVIECKKRCVVSVNCLSLNILTNSDRNLVCQLNSDRKENGVKEQFVQHGAGEYYGLKEKKLCDNNGKTCSTDSLWFTFNQSYFQFFATKLTFEEARKVCLEKKGDLASSSSEEEQMFLFKAFVEGNDQVNDAVWVGLNDIDEEGVFVWTDGSPNTYARYFGNDPDNYAGSEHCVVIVTGGNAADFRDITCSLARPFICEINYEFL